MLNWYYTLLWMLILPAGLYGQSADGAYNLLLKGLYSHTVDITTVDSLKKMNNYALLDTRERDEYAVSHMADARWVGYNTFNYKSVADLPKDTTIVVYCSVGYRSEKVGEQLLAMGFTRVYNLYGGIFEWINKGQPVVNSENETTNHMHPYSKSWGIWLKRGEKVYK